ncbi:MAG TPA: mycofactocin biosynthesis peptidyl-dipeptidase MftE [Ilumatobacter sp.]|nr:mycofactocin biosynthesis peptidyl-dipeptidase MftE [Ilumatobacter sp.]
MRLGPMTWNDIDASVPKPILVVPVGSCEQHGPHLPLHTDTVIAVALADALVAERGDCVATPPLTITASGEHEGFPGTLSIGNEAMRSVIVELVRSADWASGVVFVNGHGGNVSAMQAATSVLGRERRRVLTWWLRVPGGDPHAGHVETSIMLAIAPDEVHVDRAVSGPIPTNDELIEHGVQAVSPSGVLGDPSNSTPEDGQRMFADLTDDLCATVAEWVERTGAR